MIAEFLMNQIHDIGILAVIEVVIVLIYPLPCRKAPDMTGAREEIVRTRTVIVTQYVEAGDHGDALIILILLQHVPAEGKEALCGHVVIFHEDTAVYPFPDIFIGIHLVLIHAVVFIRIQLVYFAVPVDSVIDQCTVLIDQRPFFIIPAAVGHDKQDPRTDLPDHFPLPSLTFGTNPDIKLNRNINQPLFQFAHEETLRSHSTGD